MLGESEAGVERGCGEKAGQNPLCRQEGRRARDENISSLSSQTLVMIIEQDVLLV